MERFVEEKTTTRSAAAGAALLVLLGAATGVAPAGAVELSDIDEGTRNAAELHVITEASAAEARITSGNMATGPLQNSAKSTYVGTDGGWWVDTVATPQNVTYPTTGNTGIVQIGGTCISKSTSPTDSSAPIIQTGDGSRCMPFTAEITSEGFFTFRANSPGAPAHGQYFGDGNSGGVLDLISSTPLVLFAIPEDPAGALGVSGTLRDVDGDGVIRAGDVVDWAVEVKNSGNVRLRNLTLTGGATCTPNFVDAGKSITCVARTTLTQADIDSGAIASKFSGTGTTPAGNRVGLAEVSATVQIAGSITGEATLSSDLGKSPKAGDEVTYAFAVKNSGSVTLSTVEVTPSAGKLESCATLPLAPGDTLRCTITRTLAQSDIDAGSLALTVSATGSTAGGTTSPLAEASVTDTIAQTEKLQASYKSDATGQPAVGQQITYTATLKNTGNVTLRDLAVQGALGTAAACADTTLAPGATTTCKVTYTVTQADIDAGQIDQGLTVTGRGVQATVAQLDAGNVVDTIAHVPSTTLGLSTHATADLKVGATVEVNAVIVNTGNVTLNGVEIQASRGKASACGVTTLAPGASTDCTITVNVSQSDIDAGVIEIDVTGTAQTPANVVTPISAGAIALPINAYPGGETALVIAPDAEFVVGEDIEFTATIENSGNVTLQLAEVIRESTGDELACDTARLAPGETATCTFTHTVLQRDIDAGNITETVLAEVKLPGGATRSLAPAQVSVGIAAEIAGALDIAPESAGPFAEGERVTFTAQLTNSSNVTVENIVVTEPGDSQRVAVECAATTLAPGESTECSQTVTVSRADVVAGKLSVTWTANGQTLLGDPVELASGTAAVGTTVHAIAATGAPAVGGLFAGVAALLAALGGGLIFAARRSAAK